ncbi:alpha/beta hydrolase [Thermoflavimicrobium daqui]|uniref:Enterochelin esterase n=1 Tax=Thermoflavimicrobium daqui TaxID=2137476 RepID=A0A364K0W2_9BACL|nr:alpha/beta hydrolase-fold protein [Thermoflavimicrobium daqui]RAL21326.1 enterochelin esterase [Thermoflavimicrobium daqui]
MVQKQVKRIIKREVISSKYLHEDKQVLISLPPGYDESSSYPCLILHDGDDYFNLGRIVTQANQMISEGQIKPLIMVAVPVQKSLRTEEYAPHGARHELHQQFIMDELLPMLKERYPVSLTRENWVIGGSSLGAAASLQLAINHPQQFTHVLSQSGAFLSQTTELICQMTNLQDLIVYQSIGKSETAVSTHMGNLDLVTRNREVYRHLVEKKATVTYREKEGDHTWGFWQRDLPEALHFFFKA